MGRELKRVALDFDWPLNKTWDGYLNHHWDKHRECEACGSSGDSPTAKKLKDQWYGYVPFRPEDRGSVPFSPEHPAVRQFAERNVSNGPDYYGTGPDAVMREAVRLANLFNSEWMHHLNADDVAALVEAGRLKDLTHTWKKGEGWKPKDPPYVPTPEEVNIWSLAGFGHDSINCWVVIKAVCKRLGVDDTCRVCEGEGHLWLSLEDKQAYDDWTSTEPPAGEGYQIWETVSEGSPISPVFAAPEELAQYMAGRVWGADHGSSYETWLKFINGPGWAPSMIMNSSGIYSGVEAAFGGEGEPE